MSELIINLDTVNLVILWAAENENFEFIKNRFPKLRLIARGTELKVLGEEVEQKEFEKVFMTILDHVNKYNKLEILELEELLGISAPSTPILKSEGQPKQVMKGEPIVYGPNGLIVRARTPNQLKMVNSIVKNDILFAIGPAGTGKTYTAVALAVRALRNKEIKRIILTRPAVEAGENLGFLPGDLKEKIDPYLRPLYDALDDMIPAEKLKGYLENRTIEVAPLAFMRGRTLDNCFVILDEAQNATDMQLKMFLTRMGPTAKFIVTGDLTQVDLPKKSQSGLATSIKILDNIEGIDIVYLNGGDVVRHKLVKRILEAYGDLNNNN
ncbi:PhoH family protein [Sphingobacterium rhinopitheci]|uniref:PhoH family protein n=1 Tax=Sphingobacterium rhinopitheci TaxID=2781960 RepID=UPI001F52607B|nr:PhoH family protein [Sphingobacterium rhinopitheci]MCI0920826.1 PhoH family protein [Sphingobacterium rhinopitheci]